MKVGNWMALGTMEYMLPLTANDQIRMVGFTDFGTVEQNGQLDDFRVSAGVGFRLVIPAMGPAPIVRFRLAHRRRSRHPSHVQLLRRLYHDNSTSLA